MPRAKRQIEHTVEINGFRLIWRLHREQHFSYEDSWKGVAIHVSVAEGTRKELYLEYPAVQTQKMTKTGTDHAVINIRPVKVREHILQAMEAGWDPEARGKPLYYYLDELPY